MGGHSLTILIKGLMVQMHV